MRRNPKRDRYVGIALLLLLVAAVSIGLWKVGNQPSERLVALEHRPKRIMGTDCKMAAVVPRGQTRQAEAALRKAESALRRVEARMSCWLADSQISQLNRAAAGVRVRLSPEVAEVFHLAGDAREQTGGAFDVTCRPLVELWRQAAEQNRLPDDQRIAAARRQSRWEDFELGTDWAEKRLATAGVDLGGIAKGYAINQALAAMRQAHLDGGSIDVGGDVACFGRPPRAQFWTVDVQNPFGRGHLTTLRLSNGAVCTSGNYARYRTIEGRRYNHIIDPRNGRPAELVPSVTVLAPTATEADVWATALSVLGREGLARLPKDVEALLIVGTAEDYKIYCTPGVPERLQRPLPVEPIVVDRRPVGQAVPDTTP